MTMKENQAFLEQQLITYIGNKRSLLGFISEGVSAVKSRLGKEKLSCLDMFSGSGIVSRFLKGHSHSLASNDMEEYSKVINTCYLRNREELDMAALEDYHWLLKRRLQEIPLRRGFISELYAPQENNAIQDGERVFYTSRNAMYLDTARQYIQEIPEELRCFFLAPLLSEASIHANTSGVFKGFYKDKVTGLGCFGGTNGDAHSRILGDISLPFPVFSDFSCDVQVHCAEANALAPSLAEVDLAYLDPPYNQHPYGSNYFMLNLLADYARPSATSAISGIPHDWKRSDFNKKQNALTSLISLCTSLKAGFLLISFNSEGFISLEEMTRALENLGKVTILEKKYNTFRGSRNLRAREKHVKEYLYLVEKS